MYNSSCNYNKCFVLKNEGYGLSSFSVPDFAAVLKGTFAK